MQPGELFSQSVQEADPSHALPFLNLPVDARTMAMGGISYNPSSIIFSPSKLGLAFSASPFEGFKNIFYSAGGFFAINESNLILVGTRIRRYDQIDLYDNYGIHTGELRPSESSIDIAYTRKFSANLSASITARTINSKLGDIIGDGNARAFAFDLGMTYRGELNFAKDAYWNTALHISNLGTKIKYLDNRYDLPAVIRASGGILIPFGENQLSAELCGGYRFLPSDATYFDLSLGAEYILKKIVVFRTGVHLGDASKGNGNYFALGAGIIFKGISLDLAYRVGNINKDLSNLLYLTLGFTL